MKAYIKLLLVFVLSINAVTTNAQATKRIYNEDEVILPNNLQYYQSAENGNTIKSTVENNLITISWQTKTEINTSHFELQRSENGKDFEPIETITAGCITNGIRSYSTTDDSFSVTNKQLYYRLKIVFVNGKEALTDVAMVDKVLSNATTDNRTR
jgi:hypothetical protein